MTALDVYTVGAAGVSFLALALRGNMLKPEVKPWSSSRAASLVILAFSLIMAGEAITVFNHGQATAREAMLVTAVAVVSLVMLVNLWAQRQGHPENNG